MDRRNNFRKDARQDTSSQVSSQGPLNMISANGEVILSVLAAFFIFWILRLILRFIYRCIVRCWFRRPHDLQSLATTIERLPGHAQFVVGNAPLPDTGPRYTPPPPRGSHELAGWAGLRYGVTLGFGLGLVACWGFVWESPSTATLLALGLWCVIWQHRDTRFPLSGNQEVDAELHAAEYQAAFFGLVLGIGFGVVIGAGLHFELPVHWMVGLCVLWILIWGTQGTGVTWVYEDRKLRLSWFSIVGSKWNLVLVAVAGVQNVLLGVWWILILLLGALTWLYGALSRMKNPPNSGRATVGGTQTPEPTAPRRDSTPAIAGGFQTPTPAPTQRQTSLATERHDTAESPPQRQLQRQLQEAAGAASDFVVGSVPGSAANAEADSDPLPSPTDRGRLRRERAALGLMGR